MMVDETQDLRKRIRKLEIRYGALFEGMQELVFTCLPDGKIININTYGVKSLGYTAKSELLGRNFIDFYHNPGDRDYHNKVITKKGYLKDFEVILKKKNGDLLIGSETAYAVRSIHGTVVEQTGIITDMTARVKHEMLLRKQNMDLEEANRKLEEAQLMIIRQDKLASLGQLAAGVAHEINNPLSFIKSSFESLNTYINNITRYLTSLEEYLGQLEQKQNTGELQRLFTLKQDLKIAVILNDLVNVYSETTNGFERITAIVNSLKQFSHVDNSKQPVLYDLNQGIEGTLQILHNETKYVAEVELKLSPLPLTFCFGGEINQVLLNIVLNAVQAIKSEKRSGLGKISINTSHRDNYLVCRISDTGPGIPREIMSKIFDPFFTTKEVGQGTGLGLSISYDIIRKHNGELLVESKAGTGTVFIIKLPVVKDVKEEKNCESE